jgi:hypothetical protein
MMNVRTEPERSTSRPTRKAFLAYYGVGTLLAVLVIWGSDFLGATKAQTIVAGVILVALWVLIAQPLILFREQWRRRLPRKTS